MMRTLVTIACLIIVPAIIVSGETGPVTEPIPLLIWAASDPTEDQEAGRIDPVKFFRFLEANRDEINEYVKKSDVLGEGLFLGYHGEESGTEGTLWPAVFAKIAYKKAIGETEEKEHGLPSLVIWAMRNTGVGTNHESVSRTILVEFILKNKTAILKLLSKGDVDGLVAFFDETKSESASNDLDWKTVITDLKNNRQLFKYSCGLFGLNLCDRLK